MTTDPGQAAPRLPSEPPPSRHTGSRLVTRQPSILRSIAALRDGMDAAANRVRRQDLAFTTSAVSSGVAAASGVFAATHVVMVYRSGHLLVADLAMGTGAASVMEARLSVPDLSLTSPVAATGAGGGDVDLRVRLALPDAWATGDAHRVYVEARRVSGADATTVRVLGAWQR